MKPSRSCWAGKGNQGHQRVCELSSSGSRSLASVDTVESRLAMGWLIERPLRIMCFGMTGFRGGCGWMSRLSLGPGLLHAMTTSTCQPNCVSFVATPGHSPDKQVVRFRVLRGAVQRSGPATASALRLPGGTHDQKCQQQAYVLKKRFLEQKSCVTSTLVFQGFGALQIALLVFHSPGHVRSI